MRAFDLDPAANAQWVAVHYLHMRQYPEAGRFVRIARAANIAGAVVPDAWTRFSGSGEVDAARPVLESALSGREPADARVRGLLARLEWFDGHYWRALELIDGMDEAGSWLAPNFRFPSAIAAGLVYESMGRREDATTSYTAAMEALEEKARTLPDDYQTEGALALAAVGLGRGSEALQHAERAVALLPLSKDAVEGTLYLYLLAQVQARVGRAAEAFATLDELFGIPGFYNEKWVQRDPGFAALRAHPSFRAHIDRWSAQSGEVLLQRIAASPRP